MSATTTLPGRPLGYVRFATSCTRCGKPIAKGQQGTWHVRNVQSKSGRAELFCDRTHAAEHYGQTAAPVTPPEGVVEVSPEPVVEAEPEPTNDLERLLRIVRHARAKADELRIPVIVSPRAAIEGARLLVQGVPLDIVVDIRVFAGQSDEVRRQLGYGPAAPYGTYRDAYAALKARHEAEGFTYPEVHHEALPLVVATALAGANVLLVGPAGTGKSTIGEQVHEVRKAPGPFGSVSFGPTTPTSKLFGYNDAHGNFNTTPYRESFAGSGTFLGDELDNGHPGLVAELNQSLANNCGAFADGVTRKGDSFVFVGTANTFGRGPDRQYVGRNILDAATLDRFVTIEIGYDEALEGRLATAAFTA